MGSTGEAAEWPALGLTVTEPQTLSSFTLVPVLFTAWDSLAGIRAQPMTPSFLAKAGAAPQSPELLSGWPVPD